ncbi:MAG: acyl-CoA dehydrogenase family protein, partial [Acidimicrobiales bacterium]|nr:acyl-CoA dehydrogenase family protein [Acidimicrobiales bacterium]
MTATETMQDIDVDQWLDANWDPEITVEEWWQRLADARLTHPMLPEPWGRDWSRPRVSALVRAMVDRGALGPPSGLGMMLAAPTMIAHATDALNQRLVTRILNGQDGWCQLFSEPGAGSDLAGLQTRAERDGDEWVVTGQKVWTSLGQWADYGILIARTDPDAPKHRGITYFACPMRQDGVEVRPLREMTGRALFNEVFLDEARVPHDHIIG